MRTLLPVAAAAVMVASGAVALQARQQPAREAVQSAPSVPAAAAVQLPDTHGVIEQVQGLERRAKFEMICYPELPMNRPPALDRLPAIALRVGR